MNSIPTLQNEEAQIKLLRARTHVYGSATWLMVAQLLLTLIMPVAGAVLAVFRPEFRGYVAAVSLAAVVIDPIILNRLYMLRIKTAAKIAEQFDCAVLDLPWDNLTVGDKVEAEDIHAAARAYARCHDDTRLRGWYPESVGHAPFHLARIICQRTNLRYDRELRRSYSAIIIIIAVILVGSLFISGLVQNLPMTEWVLSMAPATPILAWAARESYRQRDTADGLDHLVKEAKKLWTLARSGECDAHSCRQRSRELQNAIYTKRANSPLVIPLLYRIKRSQLEDEMDEGAAAFLRELSPPSSQPAGPPTTKTSE